MCYVSDQIDDHAHRMGDYEVLHAIKQRKILEAFQDNPDKGLGLEVAERLFNRDDFSKVFIDLLYREKTLEVQHIVDQIVDEIALETDLSEVLDDGF